MVIFSLIFTMIIVMVLVNRKINIGCSLMIGTVILSALNGRGLVDILDIFAKGVFNYTTITLALAVALIAILGHVMNVYKQLDRMVESLENIFNSAKITIMLVPMLLGTFLVTGGALISCPMVDRLGKKLEISNERCAAVNMVFRHSLYFFYPIAPTFILATQLAEVSTVQLLKKMSVIGIVMFVSGYISLLKNVDVSKNTGIVGNNENRFKSIAKFIYFSLPLSVSLILTVAFKIEFYISLAIALLISFGIHLIDVYRDSAYKTDESILSIMIKGFNTKMVLGFVGIMIFKTCVNSISEFSDFLMNVINSGIPIELIIIICSAILSYPSASTQTSIAVLYPLILPLAPDIETRLNLAMLIYGFGFISYYISPLHLCQVLTLEYFKSDIKGLYKQYKLVIPSVLVAVLLMYFI